MRNLLNCLERIIYEVGQMKKMKCNRVDCFRYIVDESGDYCKALADKRGMADCPFYQSEENFVRKVIALDMGDYQRAMELAGTKTVTVDAIKDWLKRAEEFSPAEDKNVATVVEALLKG